MILKIATNKFEIRVNCPVDGMATIDVFNQKYARASQIQLDNETLRQLLKVGIAIDNVRLS